MYVWDFSGSEGFWVGCLGVSGEFLKSIEVFFVFFNGKQFSLLRILMEANRPILQCCKGVCLRTIFDYFRTVTFARVSKQTVSETAGSF